MCFESTLYNELFHLIVLYLHKKGYMYIYNLC